MNVYRLLQKHLFKLLSRRVLKSSQMLLSVLFKVLLLKLVKYRPSTIPALRKTEQLWDKSPILPVVAPLTWYIQLQDLPAVH